MPSVSSEQYFANQTPSVSSEQYFAKQDNPIEKQTQVPKQEIKQVKVQTKKPEENDFNKLLEDNFANEPQQQTVKKHEIKTTTHSITKPTSTTTTSTKKPTSTKKTEINVDSLLDDIGGIDGTV